MKDARGHGSDGKGAHGRYLIQKLNTGLTGNPWQTVMKIKNKATAERLAQHMRTDDHRLTNRVKIR